jgi:hypothetical protein
MDELGALYSTTMLRTFSNQRYTVPYIDNVPIKGPKSDYQNEDSIYGTVDYNDGIRRFVWEHFQGLNHVVQHNPGEHSQVTSPFSAHMRLPCSGTDVPLRDNCLIPHK